MVSVRSKPLDVTNCVYCRKTFTKRTVHQKYCSVACRTSHYEALGLKNSQEKLSEKNCLFCGETFIYSNLRNSQKYCKVDCRESDYKLRGNKVKKQNSLKDDVERKVKMILEKAKSTVATQSLGIIITDITLDSFTDKMKLKARERDGYCCQICNAQNVRLEVHHILKRSLGGSNDLENLVTLCVKCHRAIETNDENHAVKTCYKNAMKVNDRVIGEKLTNPEKINILTDCLERVFDKLAGEKAIEKSELLLMIGGTLSQTDD